MKKLNYLLCEHTEEYKKRIFFLPVNSKEEAARFCSMKAAKYLSDCHKLCLKRHRFY